MCDINERYIQLLLKSFKLELHLFSELHVQCSEWFIEKQDTRPVYECSCYCDSLFLSAGKLRRVSVLITLQLHHFQHFPDSLRYVALLYFLHFQAVSYVVVDRHMRKQRVTLKNSIHISLERLLVSDGLALHHDAATGRFFKTGDHAESGCFAAA